jgi:NAD(P)H-nitrite reductase large subunit
VKSGEEPRLVYNRVLLSSVLTGEARGRHFTEASGLVEHSKSPLTPASRSIAASSSTIISSPAHSDVFANGKCVKHHGVRYRLVEPANEQARAGRAPAGREARNHPQRGPRMR